jgi:S-adenosylmethionine decarboxylase
VGGRSSFIDHKVGSIQDYIDPATLRRYDAGGHQRLPGKSVSHQMLIKEMDLQNYLFNTEA